MRQRTGRDAESSGVSSSGTELDQEDTVYVILSREKRWSILSGASAKKDERARKVVLQAIREGKLEASFGKCVVNHSRLHKLHSVLNATTELKPPLQLDDLQLALIESSFEGDVTRLQSASYIRRVLIDLKRNTLLTDVNAVSTMLDNPNLTLDEVLFAEESCLWEHEECAPIRSVADIVQPNEYLVDLEVVPIPNTATQLSQLLASISENPSNGPDDLIFLASTNLGESVLVYYLQRSFVPRVNVTAAVEFPLRMKPIQIDRSQETLEPDRLAPRSAQRPRFATVRAKAFMFLISHRGGSLKSLLDNIQAGPNPVNVEQTFTFQVNEDHAVALIVTNPADYDKLLELTAKFGEYDNTP